ncbi:MAG TPA: hypothetical protein VFQ73_07370, partial [Flavisolibacter sp.]|nr:hypothetical protein [Flavisolibacter sp.]
MQFKQTLVRLFFLLIPFAASSQTTYLPQGAKETILIERLEIKAGTDSILNFSKARPFSRRQYIPHINQLDSIVSLSKVDQYNLFTANLSNLEWATGSREDYASKKPIWKHFYKTPATLYEVNTKDFFLAVNPVFQYYVGKEKDNDQHIFLNTRGVSLRGRIADKI